MGSSTAFLTGFVDAANRNMYETRMAAHQESVEARADFQWKERNTEAIARQNQLLEDKNKREDLQQDNEEQRIIDGNLAIMQRFYPDMPEADQLAAANNPNGVGYIPGYYSGGIRWDTEKGNFETQLDSDTRVAGVQAMHLKRSDVSDEMFRESQWFAFLRDTILRTGESEIDLKNRGYTPLYQTDPTTGFVSITPQYIDPNIPTQYTLDNSENTSFSMLKSQALNKLNAIVGFDLGPGGEILEPGIFTGIVEELTGVAVRNYSKAKANGESLLPSEPFSQVIALAFGQSNENVEDITEEKLKMGANAISTYSNNPEGLASADESLETLESVYENIRVRIHITEMFPNAPALSKMLTGSTNLQTLYDISDAIRKNPTFIAEFGLPEGEPTDEPTGEEGQPDQGFTIEEVPTGTGLSAQTRKIYTLDEVGLNKMSEAYELHASQPPPKRQRDSLIPIERYIADLFGFNHLMPMDQIAIDQLIKQHEDLISLGVIETNGD